MYQNLKAFTSRFESLSEDETAALLGIFKPISIKKKEHLFKENQLIKEIFFVSEGILRGYYTKDGKEITSNFLFGPTIFTELSTIRNEVPTKINMQAITEVTCLSASFSELEKLTFQYEKIESIFMKFVEHLYLFGLSRQHSFIFDSPQDRYLKLYSERPKVIASIPLQYIASYLGIQPETLSRIRRRIILEQNKHE
jgi:CRP/FNR family transcriptional regulator, anaerobic regulatory protein